MGKARSVQFGASRRIVRAQQARGMTDGAERQKKGDLHCGDLLARSLGGDFMGRLSRGALGNRRWRRFDVRRLEINRSRRRAGGVRDQTEPRHRQRYPARRRAIDDIDVAADRRLSRKQGRARTDRRESAGAEQAAGVAQGENTRRGQTRVPRDHRR